MDSQTIEIIGQHRLAGELLQAGLEVAFPARDRGIDLIAYAELDQQIGRFIAKPIQLKAATNRSFGIWEKYLKVNDLILAFVWNLNGRDQPRTYALTYKESIAIGEAMGWTQTASWIQKHGYATTEPGKKLCGLLDPYLMTPEAWRSKVIGEAASTKAAHVGKA